MVVYDTPDPGPDSFRAANYTRGDTRSRRRIGPDRARYLRLTERRQMLVLCLGNKEPAARFNLDGAVEQRIMPTLPRGDGPTPLPRRWPGGAPPRAATSQSPYMGWGISDHWRATKPTDQRAAAGRCQSEWHAVPTPSPSMVRSGSNLNLAADVLLASIDRRSAGYFR